MGRGGMEGMGVNHHTWYHSVLAVSILIVVFAVFVIGNGEKTGLEMAPIDFLAGLWRFWFMVFTDLGGLRRTSL
jgi:hypothetical protein